LDRAEDSEDEEGFYGSSDEEVKDQDNSFFLKNVTFALIRFR
jgi:hypothetical protein